MNTMEATNTQTRDHNLSKASEYLLGVAQIQANSLQHEIFSLLSSKYSLNEIKKALKKGTVVLDKLNAVFCEMGIQNIFLIVRRLVHVINGIGIHALQKLQKSFVKNSNQFRPSHAFEFHAQINNDSDGNFKQHERKIDGKRAKLNKLRGISLFNENYKRKIDQNKQKQGNTDQKKKDDEMDETNYKRKLFEKMRQQIESVENQLYTPITDQISSFILFERKFLETFNHFQYSEDLQKMTDSLESSNVLTQQFLSKFDLKTEQVSLFKTEIDTLIVELRMNNKVRNQHLSIKFEEIMNKFIKKRLEMYQEASIKLQLYNKLQKEKQQKKVSVGVETVLKDFAAIKNYERKIISLEQKLKFREDQRQKQFNDTLQKVSRQKRSLQMQVAQQKTTNAQMGVQLADLRKVQEELLQRLGDKQSEEKQNGGKQQIMIVMKNGVQVSSNFRQENNQNMAKVDSNGNSPKSKNNIQNTRLSDVSDGEINNKNQIRETIAEQSQFFKSSLDEEKSDFNQMKNTIMSIQDKSEGVTIRAEKQRKVRMKDIFDFEIQQETEEIKSRSRQVQRKLNKTQKLIRLKSNLSSKSLKFDEQEQKQNAITKVKQNDISKMKQVLADKKLQNVSNTQSQDKQNQLIKQLLKSGSSESYGFEKIKIPFNKNKIQSLHQNSLLNLQSNAQNQMKKNEGIKKVDKLNSFKQAGRNNFKNKQNAKNVEQKQQTKSKAVESFKSRGDKKVTKNNALQKQEKGNEFDYSKVFSLMFFNGVMESQQIPQQQNHNIPNSKESKLLKIKSDGREKQVNEIQFASQGYFSPSWASNEQIKDNDGKFHLPSLGNKKNHIESSAYKKIQKQFQSLNNASKQEILNAKDLKVQDYITILKSQGSPKLEILQIFQNFGNCYQNKRIFENSKLNVEDFIKMITYKEYDCFEIKKKQMKKQRSLSVDNAEIEHHLIDSAFKVRGLAKNNNEVQKSNKVSVPYNKNLIQKILLEGMKSRKEQTLPDLSIGHRSVHDQQNQVNGKIKNKLKKTHRKKQEIQTLLKSAKVKQLSDDSQQRELPEIKIKSIFRA